MQVHIPVEEVLGKVREGVFHGTPQLLLGACRELADIRAETVREYLRAPHDGNKYNYYEQKMHNAAT